MAAITPIRSEVEYQAALTHIECLFDAEPGTADVDTLEVLTILVERYEEQHYPIQAPDPVSAIKFRMEQAGLTQRDLVPLIGSKAKVSSVLSGRTTLSLKMIRALHEGLGIPAEVLIRESNPVWDEPLSDPARYPLKELQKLGWIPESFNLKLQAEDALHFFMGEARQVMDTSLAFARKNDGQRKNAKMNRCAFDLWVCRAALVAATHSLPALDLSGISTDFIRQLAAASSLADGPAQAKAMLAGVGIHLVRVPHLAHTYLDGAAFMLKDGSGVIALTGRYDRLDNFWFTLFHELKHVVSHLGQGGVFADDLSLRDLPDLETDVRETEADNFACQALKYDQIDLALGVAPSPFKVIQVAQSLGLSPAIVAGRYRFSSKNYRIFPSLLGNGEVSRCL